jgi:hypothetical protein
MRAHATFHARRVYSLCVRNRRGRARVSEEPPSLLSVYGAMDVAEA